MAALSIVFFTLMILSGSIYLLRFYNIQIEVTLPICCSAIVAVSFIFGIFGLLKYSLLFLSLIEIILYAIVFCSLIRKRDIKKFIYDSFTPGLIVYFLFCLIFIITIKGKLFTDWDEFTHWGDIVKVMVSLNDFGTNEASMSMFKSYPPGMALFQYILQKLNFLVSNAEFVEWLTYYAYNTLAVTFLVPFTKYLSFKKPIQMILFIIILLCVPFAFYDRAYYRIYIDLFLSFLFASGLLHLLLDDNDITGALNIYSILLMLVLSKDAGLVLAILLLVAFVIKIITNNIKDRKKVLLYSLFGIGSVFIPKILWSYNLKVNHIISNFNSKIDFNNLWQVLIGNDYSYRSIVLRNYISALGESGLNMYFFKININYVVLFIMIVICLIVILIKSKNKTNGRIVSLCSIITCILFVMGMCVIYMYKFSEKEALSLASFDRYLNIVFLGIFLFLCISYLLLLNTKIHISLYLLCLFIFIILCCPINNMIRWFGREIVEDSLSLRSHYDDIVNATSKYTYENSNIYFISQESDGYDMFIYRFSIRPRICGSVYSIGEPFYNDDIYTVEKTAEEWKKELIDNYDYVALYNLNSYFYTHYYELFEDPDHIYNNRIYAVDKQWGTLVLCED